MEKSQSELNKDLVEAVEHPIKATGADLAASAIKAGADVNIKGSLGDPVLVTAVETKNIDIVKELVKAGANVNAEDRTRDPVLVSAVWTKNIDIVKELVKAGANVDAKDRNEEPVLVSVVRARNIDIVKELVKAGANVDAKDRNEEPVLVSVVWTKNIDIVKELVKAGANVDCKDRSGDPVLVSAVWTKNIDIVKELVKAGANINIKDRNGIPVLVIAVKSKNIDIVKELVKGGADVNVIIRKHTDQSIVRLLHVAVTYSDAKICQHLVDHRACINYDDQGEVSALHLVLVEANPDNSRAVYGSKKNRDARGKCNRTFLHYAACLGSHQHIENVLSLSNISVDLKDDFGNSPLHSAVQIGNLETIKALIDAGCDTEAVDSSGRTLLHLAAIYGHSDLVDLFIDEYGLDPVKTDNVQRNCLHCAVIFRHADCVRTMLLRDANSLEKYNTKDKSDRTPSDYQHSCEKNSFISKYLHGKSVEIQIVPLKNSQNCTQGISNALCIDLQDILKVPSIGSVAAITGHDNEMFVTYVKHVAEVVIQGAVPTAQDVDVGRVVGCGSSFEGTKIGMPDEFDFLVNLRSAYAATSANEGYRGIYRDPVTGSCGLWLWNILMSFWSDCQTKGETLHSNGSRSMKMPMPPQRHPDRKTCTTWIWLYSDEMFTDLPVSIDFVPALEVSLKYAGTRLRATWLMTVEKMEEEKMCYIVPKIPNEKSKVTEKFGNQDLDHLGRVSYPTLEVEHIHALEDRVKDVYITAKCMRNVEVCGFQVKNDNGDTKSVSELVTSYRLKSVFLHLVELFLKSNMSLGKMVLMVYEQLEKCLERGHLPMFFEPAINVLAGSKLSTDESLQITKMMTRFVRSLYERDFSPEQRALDAAEEERVLEEERVVHADYDERRRKYEKERDELIARGDWESRNKLRDLLAPFLPIYLIR